MPIPQLLLIILAVGAAIFAFIVVIVVISFINIWIQARFSGAPVTFVNLLSMKLRRILHQRLRARAGGREVEAVGEQLLIF